jgi:hypothetical protein
MSVADSDTDNYINRQFLGSVSNKIVIKPELLLGNTNKLGCVDSEGIVTRAYYSSLICCITIHTPGTTSVCIHQSVKASELSPESSAFGVLEKQAENLRKNCIYVRPVTAASV